MSEITKEESIKIDIKNRRKSMMIKKNLIQIQEFQDNKNITKESANSSKRRSSLIGNSMMNLNIKNLEKEDKKKEKFINKATKHSKRKSVSFQSSIGLSSFITLKGQLMGISELVIHQEPDITEAICGCQQPNNYHIYIRESNGFLSYIYKLREFSGSCNRIFCPVNCREFTMKMKLMSESSNKYTTDFKNSLMTIQRNFKIPCFCLVRPELVIDLTKEKMRVGVVEQSFSFCDPRFTVYNEFGDEVKYIEADCCQCGFICRNHSLGKTDDCQFFIYNSREKGKPIGYIVKKTESVFSLADSYFVVFPPKIPPEEKILLSFVAVLIDYQYYEKNNDVIK